MRYGVIKGCADDGDVSLHSLDLVRIFHPRELREGDRTNV
jgi:hypothetical protein